MRIVTNTIPKEDYYIMGHELLSVVKLTPYACVCVCVCLCVCMCMCVSVCMYVSVCAYVCMYSHDIPYKSGTFYGYFSLAN